MMRRPCHLMNAQALEQLDHTLLPLMAPFGRRNCAQDCSTCQWACQLPLQVHRLTLQQR